MKEGKIWQYEVRKKFGDPSKRTLAIDDSNESAAAVSFVEELGVSFIIEHAPQGIEKSRDIVLPNMLIGKNGTYLRGLDTIKFFRWELQPTIKESEDDPEGTGRVLRMFEDVDKTLKEEGFLEKTKEKNFPWR
jgi:hypothetical protein